MPISTPTQTESHMARGKGEGHRIEQLLAQVESIPDPAAQELVRDCLQSLLTFYGDGLARMLQLVKNSGGEKLLSELLRDKLVRGMLLIHGLHPVNLETRLRTALDKVRPYMQSHGGNVDLLGLENDVARIRLHGSCKACPSSAVTLELAIRHAIEEACPDLAGLEVEGVEEAPQAKPEPYVVTGRKPSWIILPSLETFQNGEMKFQEIAGIPVVICQAKDNLYAYRNVCPACEMPLESLIDGQLECRIGHRYDVQKAGLSWDNPKLHLDPFPLLVENGAVKVSVK